MRATDSTTAAIILCGGHSSRMGTDKATLSLAGETLLQRMVRIVQETRAESVAGNSGAEPAVVVVAASEQELPVLPDSVEIVRDLQPDLGPLMGLATGLRFIAGRYGPETATLVTACDSPELQSDVILYLLNCLNDGASVVPCDECIEDGKGVLVPAPSSQIYPLCAVYRAGLYALAQQLLAADVARCRSFALASHPRWVPRSELRSFDPDLRSLNNINTPGELAELKRRLKTDYPSA
ncbi:MAG: molybdenum cofactor guanylyltransferase [Planctomycetaceae bacterium]